ncbi:SWIM zinc finger family protein [Leucobacter albus]|uniref:SWIM zinc finger family protein n=1 Tax=Leucobacter albus TaxID=272210 RepID=A0ABW3TTW0_9MICO
MTPVQLDPAIRPGGTQPRAFAQPTREAGGGLALGLAPARTATGLDLTPSFFSGFATEPLMLARSLLTLADITATRYFQYVPTTMRDPVLTANGDRLRAETFSACNGVYARLDLLGGGFDGGEIARGTTNVDLGMHSRSLLSGIQRAALLHLDVGATGLTLATPSIQSSERPVDMPDRWVRALGNVAALHEHLTPQIVLSAHEARAFLAAVPPATASGTTVWLVPARGGVRVTERPTPGAVSIAGLHRLSAAKRLLTHVTGLTVYGTAPSDTGVAAVVIELPHARLTLGLTAEPWRGHSGEGALLAALAGEQVVADSELVSALLAYEPAIDAQRIAHEAGLSLERARGALAVLAASGRVGWDLHDQAHFHRELPDDPARVERDNPRLVAAKSLAAAGRVSEITGTPITAGPAPDSAHAAPDFAAPGSGTPGSGVPDAAPRVWRVHGATAVEDSIVREATAAHAAERTGDSAGDSASNFTDDPTGELSCSCTWALTHGTGRGPCKHILAVSLWRSAAHSSSTQRSTSHLPKEPA